MMTLQRNCVEERDIPSILKQWLRNLEEKRLGFDHEKSEGGHMFSAILSTGGESVVVRLIKNGKKELIFESDCANHGRHRYNLQGKDARGKAGVLYDSLFLRWKGILTG